MACVPSLGGGWVQQQRARATQGELCISDCILCAKSKRVSASLVDSLQFLPHHANLPADFNPRDQPYGVGFTGTLCLEPRLIVLAYAFEQATKQRVPLPTPPAHSRLLECPGSGWHRVSIAFYR